MDLPRHISKQKVARRQVKDYSPRVAGQLRGLLTAAWAVIFIASLTAFGLGVYSLNLWDRIPAAQLLPYFPHLTQAEMAQHAAYQAIVQQAGFALPIYAGIFSLARIVGCVPLFILSLLLMRRYRDRLMGVLFAALLAVLGGAGIWANAIWDASVGLVPWMSVPVLVLNLLLWFGLIVLFAFPDGHFEPLWTVWLAVALVPLVVFLVFDLPIFLNPGTWPGPLSLLPNLIFVGGAFFSVIYRYRHTPDPDRQQRLRPYVWGVSVLMILYFANFLLVDVYYSLTGKQLFQAGSSVMYYVLVFEPLWYAGSLFFALAVNRSIFQRKLLEN